MKERISQLAINVLTTLAAEPHPTTEIQRVPAKKLLAIGFITEIQHPGHFTQNNGAVVPHLTATGSGREYLNMLRERERAAQLEASRIYAGIVNDLRGERTPDKKLH